MTTGIRRFAAFVAFATLWISVPAHAAAVRAWLDRSAMQLGETVTLNVEVTGDAGAAKPDFGALDQDFTLQGTQSSTSVNILNGQTTAKVLWAVALAPRHTGTLTIPALDVAGQKTQALALTVQAAAAAASGKAGDDIYVDVTVEPRAPYVQQQVSMTVKLYYAVNIVDGNLDDPQAEGIVARKLGQDSTFSADMGGRRYRVLERRYALLPEKSGALTLPAITFRGHVMDSADINSFFSRGRAVSAHGEALALDVRPRPPSAGSDAWLPARSVTLTADGIDANSTARIGEPLTLTLRLQAQGLGFEQLPELKLPKIDGADIYPDKANTQNRDDGEWLFGERVRKFAIVPNRAGSLTLPAIALGWWDTAHDRAETATVPAVHLQVQPATASPSPAPHAAPVDGAGEPAIAHIGNGSSTGESGEAYRLWRTLAMLATAAWIVTMIGWIATLRAQRRRDEVRDAESVGSRTKSAPLRRLFLDAVANADWPASARALMNWARSTHPSLRNTGELARTLVDPSQIAAVAELERACYGAGATSGLGDRLTHAFRDGPSLVGAAKPTALPPPLPPLYPPT
jgi:hypothetical protein